MRNKILYILLIIIVVLISFPSCNKEETYVSKTQDMLDITNEEKSFQGCLSRMNSVISALSTKVTVIEQQHNYEIELENGEGYFLDEEYILNTFEPFRTISISYADVFSGTTTNEYVQDLYKNEAGSAAVIFNSSDNEYTLKFVTEEYTRTYVGTYSKKNDSLSFIYTEDKNGSVNIVEFIEFVPAGNNSYLIQSQKSRCYITFDETGNIVSFYCSELSSDSYGEDDMLFNTSDTVIEITAKKWVTGNNNEYSSVHTFEDGILTHKDLNSGTIKEVSIDAEKYASAFLR